MGKDGGGDNNILLYIYMKFSKNKNYYKIMLIEEIKLDILRKDRIPFTPTTAWLNVHF